jgi:drug/metabolite transporter (DMT)-like permease
MTAQKLTGIAIGFFGVIVLIGPSSLEQLTTDTLAQLAVLGAAISYGFATTFGRRFKGMGISPFHISVGQVTAAAIILLPLMFFLENPAQIDNPNIDVWLAVIALGAFSTALAYILFFNILSSAGATTVALVAFLVPITAILLGWLVLDEKLNTEHFIGMAFIGLGLAVIDGRLWARLKKAAS